MRRIVAGSMFFSFAVAGCGGSVTLSGSIALPPDVTVLSPSTCGDISVGAFTRFLDSQDTIASTTATGDIFSGHCEYVLMVPTGKAMEFGTTPNHSAQLHYADCPNATRATYITEQSINFLFPGEVTLDLEMYAPFACP